MVLDGVQSDLCASTKRRLKTRKPAEGAGLMHITGEPGMIICLATMIFPDKLVLRQGEKVSFH
jgi:hypothetical protein